MVNYKCENGRKKIHIFLGTTYIRLCGQNVLYHPDQNTFGLQQIRDQIYGSCLSIGSSGVDFKCSWNKFLEAMVLGKNS